MRYTKKINRNYGCKMNDYMWKDNSYNHSRLGIDKLGQLEDIEEKLGIDLIKLFEALDPNQRIWSIGNFEGVKRYGGDKYLSEYKEIIAYSASKDNFVICRLCDYGKTWTFTKGELKNEKEN